MSDNPSAPDRGEVPVASDAAPPGGTASPESAEAAPTERPSEYLADIGFEDLALSPEIRRAIADRGYTRPTPVQAQAFDPVMQGKDLIVRSKTGTGKTAAFGLPLLEKMDPEDKAVRALVLCPTRELALQVAAEIQDLAKYKGIRVTAIYGGASMQEQQDALESGSPIVVGTPGRIYDHIRRKNLKLQGCRHVVLDEADEMLNQGFYEEVTRILDQLPKDRQVLLFSATVPPDIQRLISQYTTYAETLMLSGDVFTVEHIHHVRYDVSDAYPKPRNLIYMLEMEEPDNAIIFCNTRDDTDARHRGAQPQRLRRRAAQRRPAPERARAGDGQGEARRGRLHGRHRHRRPRDRHLRPAVTSSTTRCPKTRRCTCTASAAPGRIGKKGTRYQPHLRPRAGHLHRAGEEVRHRLREAR